MFPDNRLQFFVVVSPGTLPKPGAARKYYSRVAVLCSCFPPSTPQILFDYHVLVLLQFFVVVSSDDPEARDDSVKAAI